MALTNQAVITLTELTFPDITGKTIKAWGQVVISPGVYAKGGLPMGLLLFADNRTVDFNGFLRCDVWDEEQIVGTSQAVQYTYKYNPTQDTLQIFLAGVEYPNGAILNLVDPVEGVDSPLVVSPNVPQQNLLMFEATFDRTTVRG
jgi:hypothetical protein